MFPLTPNEAVFFDDLRRHFPNARVVEETEVATAAIDPGSAAQPISVSSTPQQPSLFPPERRAA